MNKENILNRAKRWKKRPEKMTLHGYMGETQEISEISREILESLCGIEGITLYKATQALKMAGDILQEESLHDAII